MAAPGFDRDVPDGVETPADFPTKVSDIVREVWEQAGRVQQPEEYLPLILPRLAGAVGADFCALAVAEEGRWEAIGQTGLPRSLPVELLGTALDQEQPQSDGCQWNVIPLAARETPSAALAVHFGQAPPGWAMVFLMHVGPAFYDAWKRVCRVHQNVQRVHRLQTLLEIAARWNQTQELETLLVQIAEAATRLMECDRASIFLWDRATHSLVGRPALGMPGGELRIPDDRGVVGQVLRTGQSLRADAQHHPEWIDRQVDSTTGYRTRSVLAAPLRSRTGEVFGVFEVLNKRQGRFTAEDEAGLEELAAQAAVALENVRDRQQLISAHRRLAEAAREGTELLGQSPAIQAIRASIQRIADTDLPVLILGENGSGK
ncbi:MAG TPA: GAF domain-containing protein, partial [Thermoguttaceae bacterium]|nr:GAF domain-containing protein [Thermoguttaceae bacterium]